MSSFSNGQKEIIPNKVLKKYKAECRDQKKKKSLLISIAGTISFGNVFSRERKHKETENAKLQRDIYFHETYNLSAGSYLTPERVPMPPDYPGPNGPPQSTFSCTRSKCGH